MATPTRHVRQSKGFISEYCGGISWTAINGIMDGLRAVHIWTKYINTRVHICILNEHIDNTQRPVPSPPSSPRCRHGDPPHATTPARYPRDRHALPAARITSPRQSPPRERPLTLVISRAQNPFFRGATRADARSHASIVGTGPQRPQELKRGRGKLRGGRGESLMVPFAGRDGSGFSGLFFLFLFWSMALVRWGKLAILRDQEAVDAGGSVVSFPSAGDFVM
ncbi:hypothetical protein BKA56DRAFT_46960 [Ilyonectria sp. MPI-CAGE-AT-0026]|nr:hypothetical protein BKA56DRAFT_46960 [Ilyonectria sp. MPI-CAGE-AT-0026]